MTKEEIARAKELDLLTYFKLVEPGNLKLVGKEYRHKVHSSLTISKDSLWCWHCIGLRGRTALKYLIDVEKVPYVEAVREVNRLQGGGVHSSQPVSLPQPHAEPEVPRDFKLPNVKKTDSETGNQIAGDARYEIYQWDVVTGKYQPTGGYNTYSVQRQGDGTYAVINNAAYATNDTMRHTLYPDGVTGVVDYSKIVDANGNPIWHTHSSGLTLRNSLGAFRHKQDSTLVAEQTAIY